MNQDLPLDYLSQLDSYVAAGVSQLASADEDPSPTTQPSAATNPSSSSLPDCFRTQRCDSCEMLFHEAATELRFTFPCGHVYCQECKTRADSEAQRFDVHAHCRRCGNIIVRRRENGPCTHPIPWVAFDARSPEGFAARFPDRFRLALGQQTGPRCQRCWLVARLQSLGFALRGRYDLAPFPGELYVCAEVDEGRDAVHGLMREAPDARVDFVDDLEMPCRGAAEHAELTRTAADICGGLGQVPMEPHFDPRGHIVVRYRLRGWRSWMEANGIQRDELPVALRAVVYDDWC